MFRLTSLIAVATALLLSPAIAGTDWSKYGSFAKTRCEDKATIADLKASLDDLTFNEGGGRSFGTASKVTIASSKTVRATAGILVCKLSMRTIEAGNNYSYNARYTITIKPDGSWKTLYQPNY
jgi:hypothetical protein